MSGSMMPEAVRGRALARQGAEAVRDVIGCARRVLLDPVVGGAPADAEALGNIFDALPGIGPQQRLRAPQHAGISCASREGL
jgi:hypothetical protein